MIDTKGPEIRTMPTRKNIHVKAAELIHVKGDRDGLSCRETICVTYDGLIDDVGVSDSRLIDYGDKKPATTQLNDFPAYENQTTRWHYGSCGPNMVWVKVARFLKTHV